MAFWNPAHLKKMFTGRKIGTETPEETIERLHGQLRRAQDEVKRLGHQLVDRDTENARLKTELGRSTRVHQDELHEAIRRGDVISDAAGV